MRSPERTSNSLTSPEPVLLTLKWVGPALMVSLAGHPSSLISTFTVDDLAPAGAARPAASPAVMTALLTAAPSSARPVVRNMGVDPPGSGSDGFYGRSDRRWTGVGARLRVLRPADVDGHRHRV